MQTLRQILCGVAALSAMTVANALTFGFDGCGYPPIEVNAPDNTGLNAIYVLHDLDGVRMSVDSPTAKWQRFSAMGAAYAQDAVSKVVDGRSQLMHIEGNAGYIVDDGIGHTAAIWVTDYSAYPMWLAELRFDARESDCSTAWIEVDGQAERIPYYSVTGVPQWLGRGLELAYNTLAFSEEEFGFKQTLKHEVVDGVTNDMIHCQAPLCQTDFTLIGDKYLRQWGLEMATAHSRTIEPIAVDAHTRVSQGERDNDNEMKVDSPLGGSAPVEVTFEAEVSDAAVYHEWEMAHDAEFVQSFWRTSDLSFTHTFRENGTVYVRLTAANDAGICEFFSDTYEVYIGESDLKCPNAFSPTTSPGVNDEWKVSYKSIVEFDCQIFDRQGRRLAQLTDPADGWDGRYGGKFVSNGVYFYVIKAKGADGKEYKLSGDINIIGYKRNETTTTQE